jgi:hypothetical protein
VRRPTCSARLRKNIASYSTYASGLEKLRPPQSALGRAVDIQKNSDQVCGNGAQLSQNQETPQDILKSITQTGESALKTLDANFALTSPLPPLI